MALRISGNAEYFRVAFELLNVPHKTTELVKLSKHAERAS